MKLEDLKRKNFAAIDFYKSTTATKNNIDNTPPNSLLANGMILADNIQKLRDLIKLPIIISSGYRCEDLNKAVGGDSNSLHKQFLAADIHISNLSPEQGLIKIKESGIKFDKCLIERNCIHIQFQKDPSKNRNIIANAYKENGEWKIIKINT